MTAPHTHPTPPVQKAVESVHELVERLAVESGLCNVDDFGGPYFEPPLKRGLGVPYLSDVDVYPYVEKLVQLVARECAQICEETVEHGHLDMGGETHAYASASAIRDRFGIKE